MKRFLLAGFVLSLYVICAGCGETYRPIIIPNPPVFPNPKAAHTVLSINDNGPLVEGTAMVIDVSGDTEQSIANVGLAPVHAVQQSAFQVLVVNHSVSGAGNTGDSLTQLTFNGPAIGSAFTISLPPNSAPNFVAAAPTATVAYVTLQALNAVGVVNTVQDSLVLPTTPVGNNPVALAVTPDRSKLYVANQGSSSISGFTALNTVGLSSRVVTPANTASPPIWLIPRSDNQRVFALETNGTLAWLDTTSTAGPDILTETPISVPSATKMVYDGNLNRIYIPGGSEVAIVDASQPMPTLPIASITITAVPPSSRGGQDPCSATAVTMLNTVDVAALPDGSRAYAGTYYEALASGVEYICPQVTVIDVASNTSKPPIAIPGVPAFDAFCTPALPQPASRSPRFRIMMAAAGDSSRAYLSSCDGGNVNIIDTSNDTYILNLLEPAGTRPPIPPSNLNAPQNPVFLIAGP